MKGSEFVRLREVLGLNRSQVSEFLGVDRTTIIRWEKDAVLPRLAAAGAERLLRPGPEVEEWIASLKPIARRLIAKRRSEYGAPMEPETPSPLVPIQEALEQVFGPAEEQVPANDPIEGIHPLRDDPATMEYGGIKRGGPDPVSEYRRDVSRDIDPLEGDQPDIAVGANVEKLRSVLKAKFAQYGPRAVRELAGMTGVPGSELLAFSKKDGELSGGKVEAIYRVLREMEGA